MVKETDQWKLNGDCYKCRRQKYCSHRCKVNIKRSEYKANRLICNAILNVFKGR